MDKFTHLGFIVKSTQVCKDVCMWPTFSFAALNFSSRLGSVSSASMLTIFLSLGGMQTPLVVRRNHGLRGRRGEHFLL